MSVIKGMEMPHTCEDCEYCKVMVYTHFFEGRCDRMRGKAIDACIKATRPDWCPLAEAEEGKE